VVYDDEVVTTPLLMGRLKALCGSGAYPDHRIETLRDFLWD
jgi:hypothetical protein